MARRATFPRVTAPMVTVAQRGVGVSRLCSPYSPRAAPGDSAMRAYIWNASIYCEECADELRRDGLAARRREKLKGVVS